MNRISLCGMVNLKTIAILGAIGGLLYVAFRFRKEISEGISAPFQGLGMGLQDIGAGFGGGVREAFAPFGLFQGLPKREGDQTSPAPQGPQLSERAQFLEHRLRDTQQPDSEKTVTQANRDYSDLNALRERVVVESKAFRGQLAGVQATHPQLGHAQQVRMAIANAGVPTEKANFDVLRHKALESGMSPAQALQFASSAVRNR